MAKFTLNAKQTLAAPLLAVGHLKKDVAKHVEVDPSTISQWMKAQYSTKNSLPRLS